MNHRSIFFVSDGTAITAETLGTSLLTQFPNSTFLTVRLPYINTLQRAEEAAEKIKRAYLIESEPPIVMATLTDPQWRAPFEAIPCVFLDLLQPFLAPLEATLQQPSSHVAGLTHGIRNPSAYLKRIEAVDFVLTYDDGLHTQGYHAADIILVGVSRSGKTPTCLYLGLHFCLKAANYPLTEEDLEQGHLPAALRPYLNKVFGLTIEPIVLAQIREERRPGSRYAQLATCEREVASAIALFQRYRIPYLPSTYASVEEMATRIISEVHLHQQVQRK